MCLVSKVASKVDDSETDPNLFAPNILRPRRLVALISVLGSEAGCLDSSVSFDNTTWDDFRSIAARLSLLPTEWRDFLTTM